ncbi:response regulator [Nocardioides solisilvae]|uniref:response regulator n=1 Tax=Nocardioides solisilvae TaxID=1542435 RepID=UPI000D74FB8F|nr:response regulator [Nocardioides solisilvae]
MDRLAPGDRTLQDLVQASPEAILVVGAAGTVLRANGRAAELLGADPRGCLLSQVLPADTVDALGTADLEPPVGPLGEPTRATGLDGRALLLDVVTAPLRSEGDDTLHAVFLRDAHDRLERELLAGRLRESEVRRRQALELNDTVVQTLTATAHALEQGDTDRAVGLLEQTLSAARRLIDDWLSPLDGPLAPGDLVRSAPSSPPSDAPTTGSLAGSAPEGTRTRVLVVDDDRDLRELFVVQLQACPDLEVVGEAADGHEAVRLAAELTPDVVLLDVAMPVMDGLQALPLILRASPGSRVVVVSAFDEDGLGARALALGAVHYVEKGFTMRLPEVVRAVLAR